MKMKRLSIKVKTILAVILTISLLAILIYRFTPSWIDSRIKDYTTQDDIVSAYIMKERLFKYFPNSDEARWEIFDLADKVIRQQERVIIGPDFFSRAGSGADTVKSYMDEDKIIEYLYNVSQAQGHSIWRYTGYQKIGNIYSYLKKWDQAEEYYNKAYKGFLELGKDFKCADVNGDLVKMYIERKQYQKALSVVERSLTLFPSKNKSQFLAWKGDIYYELGQMDNAIENYQAAMEESKKNWEEIMSDTELMSDEKPIRVDLEKQPVYHHAEQMLDIIMNSGQNDDVKSSSIEGRIYSKEQPMANVKIYLVNEKDCDGRMDYFEDISTCSPVFTDENGYFKFDKILPGRYMIVLGILPEDLEGLGRLERLKMIDVQSEENIQVEYCFQDKMEIIEPVGRYELGENEKLEIRWNPVEDADSYRINLTLALEHGYVSRVMAQNIKETSYVFKTKGIESRSFNFIVSGNDFIPAPSAVLGSFYPGAKIYFSVEAVDKNGETITDSEGYVTRKGENYPWIEIKRQSNFSKADELVLEKRYLEAIDAYNEILSNDPDNPYALLSLARIYSAGWGKDTADIDKAAFYYAKLINIVSEDFVIEEGASALYRAGLYKEALEAYESIIDYFPENSFWFHVMGELSLITGNPEKAQEYYEKYLKTQDEFRDLGPVIARLYLGDVQDAIVLLDNKAYSQKLRYYYDREKATEPCNVSKLKELLSRYKKGEESCLKWNEFQQYLLEIISIRNPNRYEKVEAFQNRVKKLDANDVLVQVLIELSKDKY